MIDGNVGRMNILATRDERGHVAVEAHDLLTGDVVHRLLYAMVARENDFLDRLDLRHGMPPSSTISGMCCFLPSWQIFGY